MFIETRGLLNAEVGSVAQKYRQSLNPPHPLPPYYHPPPLAPCLALQPAAPNSIALLHKHSQNGADHRWPPAARSHLHDITFCSGKITVGGDADSVISPLDYSGWLHKHRHTPTPLFGQIDYRFSASSASGGGCSQRVQTACAFLYQSEAFQHLKGDVFATHSNKLVCSLRRPVGKSSALRLRY